MIVMFSYANNQFPIGGFFSTTSFRLSAPHASWPDRVSVRKAAAPGKFQTLLAGKRTCFFSNQSYILNSCVKILLAYYGDFLQFSVRPKKSNHVYEKNTHGACDCFSVLDA